MTLDIGPYSSFGFICGPLKFHFNTFLGRGGNSIEVAGPTRGIGNSNTVLINIG